MGDVRLSAPWYTLRNQLYYTIGESPYVKVGNLVSSCDGGYDLSIYVNNSSIAKCLRNIVPTTYTFGNIVVKTIIHDICEADIVQPSNQAYSDPKQIADLFCCALVDNDLFVGTLLTEGKVPPPGSDILGAVVIIIDKAVIQFFNDDISDLCNNYNAVAADVFSDVLLDSFPLNFKVSFTTYDSKCVKRDDLYC